MMNSTNMIKYITGSIILTSNITKYFRINCMIVVIIKSMINIFNSPFEKNNDCSVPIIMSLGKMDYVLKFFICATLATLSCRFLKVLKSGDSYVRMFSQKDHALFSLQ